MKATGILLVTLVIAIVVYLGCDIWQKHDSFESSRREVDPAMISVDLQATLEGEYLRAWQNLTEYAIPLFALIAVGVGGILWENRQDRKAALAKAQQRSNEADAFVRSLEADSARND